MVEYRGTTLKLADGVLDTRGQVMDPAARPAHSDSLHQVKRVLGGFKGDKLDVIVATQTEADNLEKFAKLRGLGSETKAGDGAWRVSLRVGK
jgi:hypothetical protein